MPDISMCNVGDCSKSAECYRHKDSGTKPSEYRQAYFLRPDDYKGPCDDFWQNPYLTTKSALEKKND